MFGREGNVVEGKGRDDDDDDADADDDGGHFSTDGVSRDTKKIAESRAAGPYNWSST